MTYKHFINRSRQELQFGVDGKRPKIFPWSGALFFNSREDCSGWQLNTEWSLFHKLGPSISLNVGHGGDEPISFGFSAPFLFYLHFAWDGRAAQRVLNFILPVLDTGRKWGPETAMAGQARLEYRDREIRIAFHHKTLWWDFWMDPHVNRSTDPFYRRGNFGWEKILNGLLGQEKVTRRVVETREVTIPMPEGNYKAIATVECIQRKRPRWFASFSHIVTISGIVDREGKETGLPHQGKGTMPYNCGPDAIFSCTTPGRNIEKAVGKIVAECLDRRRRYPL